METLLIIHPDFQRGISRYKAIIAADKALAAIMDYVTTFSMRTMIRNLLLTAYGESGDGADFEEVLKYRRSLVLENPRGTWVTQWQRKQARCDPYTIYCEIDLCEQRVASASYMLETLHSLYCNLESVWTETTPWNMVVRRWPWSLDQGHILRVVTGSTVYNFTLVDAVE